MHSPSAISKTASFPPLFPSLKKVIVATYICGWDATSVNGPWQRRVVKRFLLQRKLSWQDTCRLIRVTCIGVQFYDQKKLLFGCLRAKERVKLFGSKVKLPLNNISCVTIKKSDAISNRTASFHGEASRNVSSSTKSSLSSFPWILLFLVKNSIVSFSQNSYRSILDYNPYRVAYILWIILHKIFSFLFSMDIIISC